MLVLAMLVAAVACSDVLDPGEEVVDLQLTPGDVTLTVGSSAYLTATGMNAEGLPVEGDVTWTSSDPDVVVVSDAGLATALAVGEVFVEAEFKGKGNEEIGDLVAGNLPSIDNVRYNSEEKILEAVGLPHEHICTYCISGRDPFKE